MFPQLVESAWAADAAARPTARSFAESLVEMGNCLGEEIRLKGAFEPTWRRKHLDVLARVARPRTPPPPPPPPRAPAPRRSPASTPSAARGPAVRAAAATVWNSRRALGEMEDAAAAAEWGASACYVVADGHGGAEAAERVVDLLPRLIGAELLAGGTDDDAVRAALQRAFLRGDAACRPAKGGACVVVCAGAR